MNGMWIFIGLVFLAVFLLAQGMVVPVFGETSKMRKRLRARLGTVAATNVRTELASLMRQKYLKEFSPFERWLESLPGMERLAQLIEQSGRSTPAYRVVLLSFLLAVGACIVGWMGTRLWYVSLIAGVVAPLLPTLKILHDRAQRRARFDEQLPEALDVIKRALKAGHPFTQSLKLVAEDMDAPVSSEFERVFTEINYGGDLRSALLGMLERMPSVSVMAVTTAVLLQKETGGNLAETLERITAVIRGRFKLARRVRTLSAEGRLSAWILAMTPLGLFAVMSFTTPDYLPALVKDPRGPNLIIAAVVMGTVGILWIRRIIRIEV